MGPRPGGSGSHRDPTDVHDEQAADIRAVRPVNARGPQPAGDYRAELAGGRLLELLLWRMRLGWPLFATARVVAQVRAWVLSAALLFAVFAIAAAIAIAVPTELGPWPGHIAELVVLIVIVVALVELAIKGQRQMVVQECVDYTDGAGAVSAKGLSTTLTAKLVDLANLYVEAAGARPVRRPQRNQREAADETAATPKLEGELNVTPEVGTLASALQSSVSSEATVKIGPLTLPLGVLQSLLGALISGPRLRLSLHHEDGEPILIAQTVWHAQALSWRLERGTDEASGDTRSVDHWLDELAVRIFTDVIVPGTDSWLAVRAFSRGLDAFRTAENLVQMRRLKLDEAEESFRDAAAADAGFALAYHNLGIVYVWLEHDKDESHREGEPLRSETALLKAIETDPGQLPSYHALARIMLGRGRGNARLAAAHYARRAADESAPATLRARALILISLALEDRPPGTSTLPTIHAALRRRAYALAYKALVLRTLAGAQQPERQALEDELAVAANALGTVYRFQRAFARSERLHREAIRLSPANATYQFALGLTLSDRCALSTTRRRVLAARQAWQAAAAIAPQRLDAWVALAEARACETRTVGADRAGASFAVAQALVNPWKTEPDLLRRCAAVLSKIGDPSFGEHVADWNAFAQRQLERAGDAVQRAQMQDELEAMQPGWERAQVALAMTSTVEWASEEWFKFMQIATASLQDRHYVELRSRNLRAQLAQAQAEPPVFATALRAAQEAVARDPLDTSARLVLADLYFNANELDLALSAYRQCLALRMPRDMEALLRFKIGALQRWRAENGKTREQRRERVSSAASMLHDALALAPNGGPFSAPWAHRSLGLVHFLLGEHEAAIASALIAKRLAPAWPGTSVILARALMFRGQYDQAEAELRETLDGAARLAVGSPSRGEALNDPDRTEGDPEETFANLKLDLAASYLLRGANLACVVALVRDAWEEVNGTALEPFGGEPWPERRPVQARANDDPKPLHERLTQAAKDGLNSRVRGTAAWLVLERAKQSGDISHLNEALALIDNCLSYNAIAHGYLLQGLVLELQARAAGGLTRSTLLDRAHESLARYQALDTWGEFDSLAQGLDELLNAARDQA